MSFVAVVMVVMVVDRLILVFYWRSPIRQHAQCAKKKRLSPRHAREGIQVDLPE
jgi:hypothetical protein